MDFPIQIKAIRMGLSIIYFNRSQVVLYQLSLRIFFTLTNSVVPDEMPPYVKFHLGLHCLQKYPFRGFQNTKD